MIKKVIFFLLKLISQVSAYLGLYIPEITMDENDELSKKEEYYKFRPFDLKVVNVMKAKGSRENPIARSGHRIVSDESYIYSFGGYNPEIRPRAVIEYVMAMDEDNQPPIPLETNDNHCLFKEMWKFHIDKREWRCLLSCRPDMPAQVASNAMLILGKIIFVSFNDFCFFF